MYAEKIQFVSSAYESLKSMGIDIISSNDLRADIANIFSNEFPFVSMWMRDEGQGRAELLLPLYMKFFEFTEEPNLAVELGYPPDKRLSPDYDSLLKSQEFINILSSKRSLKVAIVSRLANTRVMVRETIKSIDQELETF